MGTIKKYSGGFILVCICFFYPIQSCQIGEEKQPVSFSGLLPKEVKDSIFLSAGNPFSPAKAELGRYFFYDRRISSNKTKSCASCHDPLFSFTDGYRRSIGAKGDLHQRNATPLINLVYYRYLTSADSSIHFPEDQINNPMFRRHPEELGWNGNEQKILGRLRSDSFYNRKMKEIFPGDGDPFTVSNLQSCISSFVKTILSFDSPFDRYTYANDHFALTEAQKRGMALFFSDRLACNHCHAGINFSTPSIKDHSGNTDYYFNTGLYNMEGKGHYPPHDQGLFEQTNNLSDMGKFRVPTLRNLAFTSPYFHDGSATTLEEVISIYEEGGRAISAGPFDGDGRKNPYKNPLINGFRLSSQERKDLINFLLALSDTSVCNNPYYANPFKEDETKH